MVYKNGFVVAIRDSNKNVLRDNGNKVKMPFYEEYDLVLKNKTDTKAVAQIYIDGEDVINGKQLIIPAGDTVNIERFIEDDLHEGRRFQFVPQDDSRIQHKRGEPELGIIEVKFKKERKNICIPSITTTKLSDNICWPRPNNEDYEITLNNSHSNINNVVARGMSFCNTSLGGTAEGSRSTQSFKYSDIGELECFNTVIRLKLIPKEKSETVSDTRNIFCIHCGVKNPYKAKYCMGCGEKLEKR